MLLLIWYGGSQLSRLVAGSGGADQRTALERSMLATELLFVAGPPLLFALAWTRRPAASLRLRPAGWQFYAAALLLAVSLHPLLVELNRWLQQSYSGQSRWLEQQMQVLLGGSVPVWSLVLVLAVLPAACEELAFRGFILTGLQRRSPAWVAVLLSALLFGFFHMSPHQFINATLLGIFLGLIAVRSGSVLPGMLFHATNNTLVLLVALVQAKVAAGTLGIGPAADLLFRNHSGPGMWSYRLPVLLIAAGFAIYALRWFLARAEVDRADAERQAEGDETAAAGPASVSEPAH